MSWLVQGLATVVVGVVLGARRLLLIKGISEG
jgi:hypothetical protein